jgi:tRNA A37 threonylcarbamoyladenosine synthetase subunit TsaC/SUA5/YrdC
VNVSENISHRIEASTEHIFPASKDHVAKAIDAINGGQVIAVPTDTIYGFSCDAWLVFLNSLLVLGV